MTATFHVGDAIQVMNALPEKSVDLILSSPPFLALRSYLPADHPNKQLEGGSQSTPGAYIDWLTDVVEACDRVLAPHGSLCIELGDTYAGSGGAGGDYSENGLREGQPTFRQGKGNWPLPKSLALIPELFRLTLVYGINPLTGRTTERWRLRNVIRWVRPNPPVGALGDKFRPATSELMVFCKSAKRFFDLDAVREPHQPHGGNYRSSSKSGKQGYSGFSRDVPYRIENPAGAPPLDWWNIPPGGYQGAHYAVWPPELLIRPIKAMCPEKVCRVCGEPSRRIVNDRSGFDQQPALAAHIKERREATGITSDEINGWFGFKEIAKNWERVDQWGAAIPNAEVWPILKQRLSLSDEFDDLVFGERRWTESTVDYLTKTGQALAPNERRTGGVGYDRGGGPPVVEANRIKANRQAPDQWSDCGHNNWRPGLVLDPFVGSGTTLAVATGHGRDAVGIDLDARNFDLALERVGPLILQRGEVAA